MKLKLNQSKIKQGSKDRLFLVLGYIQIQVTQRHLMNDAVFCFAIQQSLPLQSIVWISFLLKFSPTSLMLTFNDAHHMYRILLFVVRC